VNVHFLILKPLYPNNIQQHGANCITQVTNFWVRLYSCLII